MSLSRFLINRRGVERVVICEILQRAKANRHFQISLEYFNQRVVSTNDILKKDCEESTFPFNSGATTPAFVLQNLSNLMAHTSMSMVFST
jgi:hypothetical protein